MSQRWTSFILKETKSQKKLMTKKMMTGVTVVLAMKVKTVLMMTTDEVQTCCTNQKWTKYKKRKVPRIIRYVKYNKEKDPENYFREQLMLFVPW